MVPIESTLDIPSDKEAFLRQVPKRIAAIEENWALLSQAGWSEAPLNALYGRVREISEASNRFDLYQLNESVFAVEVYLSSFIGASEPPAQQQLESIEGLLQNLKASAESIADTSPAVSSGDPAAIYFLGAERGELQALAEALAQQNHAFQFFDNSESLKSALDTQRPLAIITDTGMLPGIAPVSDELVRLKSQASVSLPLIFVSSSNTLQLRIDAIRAGGDAYFVEPLDTHSVAQQVMQLAASHSNPDYRVLVVEDDPTQADFAAGILRNAGMQVSITTEPMKVLDAVRSFAPDLILMDIYMPEVNGIELTSVIREYDELVGIPIVFLSGEQNADKQLQALSVGGDDFVAKPIRPKHLIAVVENRIRRSRLLARKIGSQRKHDKVTGLLSRQQFLEQVAKSLEADPMHAQPTGILLIGPDNLEQLQEQLGIGGVDELTAQLANSVRCILDPKDASAKLRDHTLALLVKRSSNNQIHDLCTRLHEQVDHLSSQPSTISVGIGVCLFDENLDDPGGLINRAESAMRKAQKAGPRQTHIHTFADEVDTGRVRKEDDITASIRDALSHNRFIVQYQPLLDLQTRGSENYEIILRLPTPNGDLLGERQMREPAQQAGLQGELDRWLLERALDILKQRRGGGRQTQIFVHQSASAVGDANHPAWLLGRLRSQQMVGTGLVLDFRLSDLSSDLKAAQNNIAALRDMDVDVSLSRFPEKEAAFKVLRYVKARYISIAPRLLKAERNVISEVISQSHKAGAKVIVSNIDDPRSIDLHWSSGADFLQGNFIQRPLDNMEYDFSQVVI